MDTDNYIELEITMLNVLELHLDEDQPRKYIDPDKFDELKKSIKAIGIQNPLLYRKFEGKNIIVSGECRHKAAKELEFIEVPARLVHGEYRIVALTENMHHNPLIAMEEAISIKRLLDDPAVDRKEIMKKLGKAESTLSEILKPAELPKDIQDVALTSALWSRNRLLKLAKIKDINAQKREFEKMKKAVDKKEADKLQKRLERQSGEKVKPENTKPKSTPDPAKKIAVFKSHVTKLHDRVKKEMTKKWQDKDKNKLKHDLESLMETIKEFLSGQPDEKEQPEKLTEQPTLTEGVERM